MFTIHKCNPSSWSPYTVLSSVADMGCYDEQNKLHFHGVKNCAGDPHSKQVSHLKQRDEESYKGKMKTKLYK